MPEDLEAIIASDPLGELARKERKALLMTSLIALAMAKAGLVPTEINFLGIKTSQINTPTVFWLVVAIVMYFLISFVMYALPDFFKWWAFYKKWRYELERNSWHRELDYEDDVVSPHANPPQNVEDSWRAYSMSHATFQTVTFVRIFVLDLGIPLLVACIALFFAVRTAFG